MKIFAQGAIALALSSITLLTVAGPAAAAEPATDTRKVQASLAMSQAQLFTHVESLDRAVFDAFNTCDLKKLESFFIPAVEFYHDKDGASFSRDKFMSDVKKNVCGKFRRELVPGTLEVFPLGTYGAVYSGTHRFCQFGATRCEGQGRFMSIWQNKDGEWRMTRLISFDHRAAP
ncbi:MAG: nuclear transport factor 2 family protein [Betaproteobacteria bacterium]